MRNYTTIGELKSGDGKRSYAWLDSRQLVSGRINVMKDDRTRWKEQSDHDYTTLSFLGSCS